MAAASAQEVAAMDAAIREVRAQYARGKVRVEANAGGFFASEEERSIRAAYLNMGVLLEKWASTYRTWAVLGRREDGSEYAVQRFLDFGRVDLADAVERIVGEAYDRSLFAAVKHAAAKTAETVTTPALWPAWMKWAAAGVGALVVVVAVAALVRR
ncbi:hypothetical protein CYFUS_001699 [Cystobacter fuscus]|uniref:Uncharacterized protein n=1 Tax=Cystobacter fuscus TaxID=43 RepID=A0A250IX25_9BACT|nr:hypothetical protein [Cystobacter fuscus]ATB36285.1 hypothetical protein CYFUS_001699 [Cystobacter fuscus]